MPEIAVCGCTDHVQPKLAKIGASHIHLPHLSYKVATDLCSYICGSLKHVDALGKEVWWLIL
jgi:hypothetical protein